MEHDAEDVLQILTLYPALRCPSMVRACVCHTLKSYIITIVARTGNESDLEEGRQSLLREAMDDCICASDNPNGKKSRK